MIVMILMSLLGRCAAQEAQLRPRELICAGVVPLQPGSYAIPCATDWNGDGRKDLLVGYQTQGKIALFVNTGSDSNPAFEGFANLQAGGTDIAHPSGGCGAPAPWVGDYDNDGKRDLLVGEGNYGYVFFYRNTNTDTIPLLAPGVQLKVGNNPLTVTYRATPYIYDWDGDGLSDLLCGNGDGYVYLFRNTGTAQLPVYAAAIRLQAGGLDLNLGIRSVVRMFDWDGDGKTDLLGSSNDGVYWCKNLGAGPEPLLQQRVPLCAPVAGSGLVPINVGPRMRLDVVDWNSDGVTDLLVGDASGKVSFFEAYRFAFTDVAWRPDGTCVLRWRSSPNLSYSVWTGPTVDGMTNLVGTGLVSGGNETGWTNSTAQPQQFYRVQM